MAGLENVSKISPMCTKCPTGRATRLASLCPDRYKEFMEIDWLSVLLFCGVSIGHAALMVAVVNRVHACPVPEPVLHRARQMHDLSIVALPALFVCLAGFSGPQIFYGGPWYRLPLPVLAYLALCGAVALSLPFVALRRRLSTPTKMEVANHSRTFDVARGLGFRPVGSGPYRFMTHIPGNEFLKIELAEKQYLLPRLPAQWDGLSILHLSDLHFIGTVGRAYFERVAEIAGELTADLVVFTGDLLDREDLLEWLPVTLGRLKAPLGCFFVLGNHDSYLKNTDEIRRRFEEFGWRGLAGRVRVIEHEGRGLALCGSECPWMGLQPDLAQVAADHFRLFLSHTPDNIQWARRHNIDLMLSGHNHGGQVRLPVFGPVYAPSAYGAHYASGAFWEPPTLLYVSRGISGKHPLRWNCPPELTKLVLRRPT